MRLLFGFACFFILALSCNNNEVKTATVQNGDGTFDSVANAYLKGYLDWRPLTAVSLGMHEYDGKVSDYSKPSLDKELQRLKAYDQKLDAIDSASLSTKMFYDLRILRNAVKNEITNFDDLKLYSINPMTYAGLIDPNLYLKRNYAPLEERLQYLIATEKQIPALFAAAKTNLADSIPKPYIETAISICEGNAGFMKGDLLVALKDVKNDSLMATFKKVNDSAIASIHAFIAWLQKEKMPKSNNHYAIGEQNYKNMLLYSEDLSVSPERILELGLAELKKEQDRFNTAAKIIDPSKKPIDVFHAMQKEHPVADSLIPTAKKHLEMIRQYLIDKNIITMPSEVRVQVKETPQYARATSTASMDVAGPFEKATESYYYITPVDPTWTEKQKSDWLSQFDYYSTDNISVHEAYPGHYTQFLHLNASSATKLEKIFNSYAFVEGWAHYCEIMMVEEGFGNSTDRIKAAKYRMAQSADALLRICRLCVSVKMHCQGMTIEEGTKFLMDNWYQGQKPAYQEALRGSFDPGYLFYTIGKLEILKLREDYKKQEGSNYSLKKFNDAMTDNGMPPVGLLREILLKDKNSWKDVL
ncbi:MAG: DUF885 domain-containing protein [Bacteroidota bacterium]